ncbi:MAG: hypothetical protein QOF77_1852, partial [Solirubrobacteraceae bacterium]|nr:hypothetical protein [Solirubrobacteraceae bacterium]
MAAANMTNRPEPNDGQARPRLSNDTRFRR